jgi:hypothetical protein
MSEAARKVITIFTPQGEMKEWVPLSVRIPEFLEKFGPDKGYRVVVEATDFLTTQPGLLELYKAAIAAGRRPEEAGLPTVQTGYMVFTAKLINERGETMMTASTHATLGQYKSWEQAETNARQRLMQVCGFGGDMMDADELGMMSSAGFTVSTPQFGAPVPEPEIKPVAQVAAVAVATPAALDAATPEGGGSKSGRRGRKKDASPVVEEKQQENPVPQEPKQSQVHVSADIPEALVNQIRHLEKVANQPQQALNSIDEARVRLKDLINR